MKERALFFGRFALVIPGGLGAAFLALFPTHIAVVLILHGVSSGFSVTDVDTGEPTTFNPEWIERYAVAFVLAYVFVFVGAKIAPAFKVHTAGSLVPLWCMGAAGAFAWAAASGRTEYAGVGWVDAALILGLHVAGGVAAFVVTGRRAYESDHVAPFGMTPEYTIIEPPR